MKEPSTLKHRKRNMPAGVGPNRLQQLVLSIVIGVLVFIVMVSFRDASRLYQDAISTQRLALRATADEIEHLLQSSQDQLKLLTVVLEHPALHKEEDFRLLEKATIFSGTTSVAQANPSKAQTAPKFHLSIEVADAKASLSGYGDPGQFTSAKQALLLDVAALTRYFMTVHNQLTDVQWLYFVSKDDFILLYPETTAEAYLFDQSTMGQEFYTLALPDSNPSGKLQATRVYDDEAGAGHMVTLSQPVYRDNEFMGVLALDFTLNQIQRILQKHLPKDTAFVLINQHGETLALVGDPSTALGESASRPIGQFQWQLNSVRPVFSVYLDILMNMAPVLALLVLLVAFLVILLRSIRANSEIYNTQLRFEQVVNQSVQLMAILDTQGTMLYVNDQAVKLSGVSRAELIGKPFEEGPWWRWSEDLVKFLKESYPRCRSGESIHQDVVHYGVKGQPVYVEFSLNPIRNAMGDIGYLVANGMDVTDRVKLKESMEKLSKLDMLTDISNRRGASEVLEHEMARAQRQGEPLCILLGDIDYFKHVNDTYGHQVGDKVLIQVSHLMQSHLREYDHLGRWGGEEFIVILPGTELAAAMEIARRLCAVIEAEEFIHAPNSENPLVTMTFGVAAFGEGMDFGALIKRADDALYRGKREGRNRAVSA